MVKYFVIFEVMSYVTGWMMVGNMLAESVGWGRFVVSVCKDSYPKKRLLLYPQDVYRVSKLENFFGFCISWPPHFTTLTDFYASDGEDPNPALAHSYGSLNEQERKSRLPGSDHKVKWCFLFCFSPSLDFNL